MAYALLSETAAPVPRMSAAIERLGVSMSFAKGREIFGQDQDADLIHALASGAVRTTHMLSDGRRQIGNFYYGGDVIGPETRAVHRFSAEALADCTIRVVKRSTLHMVDRDGELESAIREATRRELERTQEHLLTLGGKTACQRVASFLMSMAEPHAAVRVSLPMTRQDMADYLDLTIETVSRMVTQLQVLHIVEFTGSREFRVKRWDELQHLAA